MVWGDTDCHGGEVMAVEAGSWRSRGLCSQGAERVNREQVWGIQLQGPSEHGDACLNASTLEGNTGRSL